MLPLFNPNVVKSAFIDAVVAASTPFPAPGTNSNFLRYIIALGFSNRTVANIPTMALQDVAGGNNLVVFWPWAQTDWLVLSSPVVCGRPGANAMQLTLLAGAAQNIGCWVQFADVVAPLTTEIFRS